MCACFRIETSLCDRMILSYFELCVTRGDAAPVIRGELASLTILHISTFLYMPDAYGSLSVYTATEHQMQSCWAGGNFSRSAPVGHFMVPPILVRFLPPRSMYFTQVNTLKCRLEVSLADVPHWMTSLPVKVSQWAIFDLLWESSAHGERRSARVYHPLKSALHIWFLVAILNGGGACELTHGGDLDSRCYTGSRFVQVLVVSRVLSLTMDLLAKHRCF